MSNRNNTRSGAQPTKESSASFNRGNGAATANMARNPAQEEVNLNREVMSRMPATANGGGNSGNGHTSGTGGNINTLRRQSLRSPFLSKRQPVRVAMPGLQLKSNMTVDRSDSPAEQEADRVSREVMAGGAVSIGGEPGGGNATINRMCDTCAEENPPETVSAKSANGGTVPTVSSGIASSIRSMQSSGGSPLPKTELNFFNERFGRDFSHVRVHRGSKANEINEHLNSTSATIGQTVIEGKKAGAPGSYEQRKTMAHELTHTVQNLGKNKGSPGREVIRRRGGKPPVGDRRRSDKPRRPSSKEQRIRIPEWKSKYDDGTTYIQHPYFLHPLKFNIFQEVELKAKSNFGNFLEFIERFYNDVLAMEKFILGNSASLQKELKLLFDRTVQFRGKVRKIKEIRGHTDILYGSILNEFHRLKKTAEYLRKIQKSAIASPEDQRRVLKPWNDLLENLLIHHWKIEEYLKAIGYTEENYLIKSFQSYKEQARLKTKAFKEIGNSMLFSYSLSFAGLLAAIAGGWLGAGVALGVLLIVLFTSKFKKRIEYVKPTIKTTKFGFEFAELIEPIKRTHFMHTHGHTITRGILPIIDASWNKIYYLPKLYEGIANINVAADIFREELEDDTLLAALALTDGLKSEMLQYADLYKQKKPMANKVLEHLRHTNRYLDKKVVLE